MALSSLPLPGCQIEAVQTKDEGKGMFFKIKPVPNSGLRIVTYMVDTTELRDAWVEALVKASQARE